MKNRRREIHRNKQNEKKSIKLTRSVAVPKMEMIWRLIVLRGTKPESHLILRLPYENKRNFLANPINQVIAFYFEPHHLRAHFENDS